MIHVDTAQAAYVAFQNQHHPYRHHKAQVKKVGRFIVVAENNKVTIYGCPIRAAQSLGLRPSPAHEQLGVECEGADDGGFKVEAR